MKLKVDHLTKWSLVSVFVVLGLAAFGQRTITGTVTDAETSEPLIGANILIVGTSTGTVTDFDGTYSLEVPEGANQLEFSYTGYASQTITLGASDVVDVALGAGEVLDEVVVVGYGTVKKKDLTGAVVKVGEEDFNKGVLTSPDQLIQGKVSGVQVLNNSGAPGAASTIRIRGNSSVRSGNSPLFVVDGVPLDGRSVKSKVTVPGGQEDTPGTNPLNFINPNDIESMEILKDASATAIYGSRGANGVVIITTKKGKTGAPAINFNVTAGVSNVLRTLDIMDGDQYRAALSQYGRTSGDFGDNVDAFDEITRTALTQTYNLSVSGGNDRGNYRISGGITDQEGVINQSGLLQYTGSLKGSYNFMENDRLTVDVTLLVNHSLQNAAPVSNNAGFEGSLIGMALQWNPTRSLFRPDGSFELTESNSTINPLAYLDAHEDKLGTTRILGSISPSFKITDDLTYRFQYSIDNAEGIRRMSIQSFINLNQVEGRGWATFGNNKLTTQQFTHTLSYNKDISSNLSVNAVVGYEYQQYKNRGISITAQDFLTDELDLVSIMQNSSQSSRNITSFEDPNNELQSYFGRANFNIKDKYLLTATLRADGSSKFGENNRYGYFPSFALGWNLHNEGILNELFDNLKLRIGWGQTGNQEFPAGSAQGRFGLTQQAIALENVANPDLKWETSTTLNVGFDFAMFDYKLSGSIEYFNKTTEDLLFQLDAIQPAPATKLWVNLPGQVRNSGVEMSLDAFLVENDKFSWQIGGNVAFLSNELSGYDGPPVQTGAINGQGLTDVRSQRLFNGQPLNVFFLREYTGLNAEGFSTFVNNEELRINGDPNPDVLLGLTTRLSFGNFDFNMAFNGAFGHQVYNNTANAILVISNLGTRNLSNDLVGGSIQENTANPSKASTRYLENGDYLRLNNATLSYNLGNISNTIKNARIFITGQNLLLFTAYSGFDPEVNTDKSVDDVPSFGIEYTPYPTVRTIVLGASFGF